MGGARRCERRESSESAGYVVRKPGERCTFCAVGWLTELKAKLMTICEAAVGRRRWRWRVDARRYEREPEMRGRQSPRRDPREKERGGQA